MFGILSLATGKWEWSTEQEKIGGTNYRRSDFDESRMTDEYTVKDGIDVSYPVLKLWINKSDGNLLKREEYALSGMLMRSNFYPKWKKIIANQKKLKFILPKKFAFLM